MQEQEHTTPAARVVARLVRDAARAQNLSGDDYDAIVDELEPLELVEIRSFEAVLTYGGPTVVATITRDGTVDRGDAPDWTGVVRHSWGREESEEALPAETAAALAVVWGLE